MWTPRNFVETTCFIGMSIMVRVGSVRGILFLSCCLGKNGVCFINNNGYLASF